LQQGLRGRAAVRRGAALRAVVGDDAGEIVDDMVVLGT
jgi:hypothetical protein